MIVSKKFWIPEGIFFKFFVASKDKMIKTIEAIQLIAIELVMGMPATSPIFSATKEMCTGIQLMTNYEKRMTME